MKMAIVTAHAGAACLQECILTWGDNLPIFLMNGKGGMLPAYQMGYWHATGWKADLIAFIHDDVKIMDPGWHTRVANQFQDPSVGLVGFGGALGHGSAAMYSQPYRYQLLARHNFMSNMKDAENHGKRFIGECDAAVLDGFAMIVRREVLQLAGGWPIGSAIGYVCYDYWLSCITRRLGYRIRLVGIPCEHLGGQTFVKLGVGKDPKHWEQYIASHRYIYDEFQDVLPFEVSR